MRVYNKLFLSLLIVGITGNALAFDASSFMSAWNVPQDWSECNPTDAKDAIIGREKNTCNGIDYQDGLCYLFGSWYVHGFSMMVARNVNENGVYLCPTAVGGSKVGGWDLGNISWNKPYSTVYYETPAVDSSNCVWLCKSGYHGDGCNQTSYNGCNFEPLRRSNYDGTEFDITKATQNVEDDVAMFVSGEKYACGKTAKSPFEHDIILGISEWLNSGHGAWVQPFVVRANYEKYSAGPGYAQVYAIGTPTLVCRSGYVVNSLVNDCVPVDADACNLAQSLENGNICDGFDFTDYNSATMEYFYSDTCSGGAGNGGWAFKCKDSGYGFQSSSVRECIECPAGNLNGISPDGVCVRCSVGSIFDENASSSNYCVTATALNKDRLKFGPNKDSSTLLSDQCWTKSDTDEYADCVWGTLNMVASGYQVSNATAAYKPNNGSGLTVNGTVYQFESVQPSNPAQPGATVGTVTSGINTAGSVSANVVK